jgi:hypothetical protein
MNEIERRKNANMALAIVKLEGFEPSPEFMADFEATILGTMTLEEARAANLERAMAKEKAYREKKSVVNG